MNSELRLMISERDANKRAKLAVLVQADMETMGTRYLALAARQEKIVRALLAAGFTHLSDGEEELSLEGLGDA